MYLSVARDSGKVWNEHFITEQISLRHSMWHCTSVLQRYSTFVRPWILHLRDIAKQSEACLAIIIRSLASCAGALGTSNVFAFSSIIFIALKQIRPSWWYNVRLFGSNKWASFITVRAAFKSMSFMYRCTLAKSAKKRARIRFICGNFSSTFLMHIIAASLPANLPIMDKKLGRWGISE